MASFGVMGPAGGVLDGDAAAKALFHFIICQMAFSNAVAEFIGKKPGTALALRLLFPLTLVVISVLLLVQASTVLMWYDEIATYEPAHLPRLEQTVDFFSKGFDTPSPIPALLMRESIHIIGDSDLKDRLVFLAFFLVTCSFLYGFVQRRYPRAYALAAMLFLAGIPVREYAVTMRAYIFLLCGAAGMMYFWQRAGSFHQKRLNLIGLWCSFAFAVLSHAFGIFLFVPFAVAELPRSGTNLRRADKSVWAVLLTAPASLALLLPAMIAAKAHYAHGFWSRPTLANLGQAYALPLALPGFGLLCATIVLALLTRRYVAHSPDSRDANRSGFTVPEWTLLAGLILLPVVGVGGALVLGAFHPRYVLPVILGIDAALIGFAARLNRSRPIAGYLLAGLFLVYAIGAQHRGFGLIRHGHFGAALVHEAQTQPWIGAICASNLPVLGGTPHDFFVYQHYAPACVTSKLYYAADAQRARSVPDLFTDEQNMIWFSKFLPLKVVPFETFLDSHPEFLVFSSHNLGGQDAGWLLPELAAAQDGLHVLSKQRYDSSIGPVTLYTVQRAD